MEAFVLLFLVSHNGTLTLSQIDNDGTFTDLWDLRTNIDYRTSVRAVYSSQLDTLVVAQTNIQNTSFSVFTKDSGGKEVKQLPYTNLICITPGDDSSVYAIVTSPTGVDTLVKITLSPDIQVDTVPVVGDPWSISIGAPDTCGYDRETNEIAIYAFPPDDPSRFLYFIDTESGVSKRGLNVSSTKIIDWSWDRMEIPTKGKVEIPSGDVPAYLAFSGFEAWIFNPYDGTVFFSERVCEAGSLGISATAYNHLLEDFTFLGTCGDKENTRITLKLATNKKAVSSFVALDGSNFAGVVIY
jgi:hypothetical protein